MSHSSFYRNHRSRWTVRELDFVEKHYRKDMSATEIADTLGRTPDSIRSAAYGMGCSHKMSEPWTESELSIVRAHYAQGGRHIVTLLPGRTLKTIGRMARKMGVMNARGWSQEEERILATYYPVQGTAAVKYLPGRTAEAVKIRACDLGIIFLGGRECRQQMWNEEELSRLKRYMHLPLSELVGWFPGRSYRSVEKARGRLKKKEARENGHQNPLTPSARKNRTGR